MIQRVAFVSLYQAQKLTGRADTVVISVCDRHYRAKLQSGFADVLDLYFDDYDPNRDGQRDHVDPFTAELADIARQWVIRHHSNSAALSALVHCYAGLSRSAALAWWINQEFNIPLTTSFTLAHLNGHVLHTLNPSITAPEAALVQIAGVETNADLVRVFDEADWPWMQPP